MLKLMPHRNNLQRLAALKHCSLVAIRDITQGSDGCRLLSPQVIENIQQLNRAGLHFEAQLEFSQIQLCDAFLQQLEANLILKWCLITPAS